MPACCILLAAAIFISQVFIGRKNMISETFNLQNSVSGEKFSLSLNADFASEDITVLVNGDKYRAFDKKMIRVGFSSNTVIEVFNGTEKDVNITVSDMTDGFAAVPSLKKYVCKSGITYICRCVCGS